MKKLTFIMFLMAGLSSAYGYNKETSMVGYSACNVDAKGLALKSNGNFTQVIKETHQSNATKLNCYLEKSEINSIVSRICSTPQYIVPSPDVLRVQRVGKVTIDIFYVPVGTTTTQLIKSTEYFCN